MVITDSSAHHSEETMIVEFACDRAPETAEAGFQSWRARHPRGFVINRKGRDTLVLHVAACNHFFDDDDGQQNTAKPKICSTDRDELEGWAGRQSARPIKYCASCKPARRAQPRRAATPNISGSDGVPAGG